LFKGCINLFEIGACKGDFGVDKVKEVCDLIERKELLFTATCPVLFVNAYKLNTINRYYCKIGFNICCE